MPSSSTRARCSQPGRDLLELGHRLPAARLRDTAAKPLVDHRLGKKFFMSVQQQLPTDMPDAVRHSAMAAAEALVTSGELREELLPVLWEPVGLKRDDFGGVALMLSAAGVLFLAEHTQQGRRWVMPMRLPDVQSNDAKNAWALTTSELDTEVLGVVMSLGYFAPPGIVERLMAACYGLGKYHKFWKRGALIETDTLSLLAELRVKDASGSDDDVGLDASSQQRLSANQIAKLQARKEQQLLEPSDEPKKQFDLWIELCGNKSNRSAMWAMLSQVRGIAQGVIDDFPGLSVTSEFCCPGCKDASERSHNDGGERWKPTRWPLDEVAKRPIKCEKCGEVLSPTPCRSRRRRWPCSRCSSATRSTPTCQSSSSRPTRCATAGR